MKFNFFNLKGDGGGKMNVENIYHCCVQRTASQWIKRVLSDKLILKASSMSLYNPEQNFIGTTSQYPAAELSFPQSSIISPLYIDYKDFLEIPKPENYKVFFVMRDPRDLLISYFFSVKFSHSPNRYVKKMRAILAPLDTEGGISYLIEKINADHRVLYYTMRSWYIEGKDDKETMICRYEDLTGKNQLDSFDAIFCHLGLQIERKHIKKLLKRYSFKKLTGGRRQGKENRHSHLRKGISGDWKNHFSEHHKTLFKDILGQLLIDLDYEKNLDW